MSLLGGRNSPGDGHQAGGGPPPAGNGSKPVDTCGNCQEMTSGGLGSHVCRPDRVSRPSLIKR